MNTSLIRAIVVCGLATACCSAFSMTPQEEKAWKERVAKRMKDTGGVVNVPGSQKGSIRFVNAQAKVSADELGKMLSVFTGSMRYDARIVAGKPVTASDAEAARQALKANVAVFIVDDAASKSAMLVSPEERWAIVNVARLVSDNPAQPFVAARTRKETLRALAFLTAGSSYDHPLMQPLLKVSDLDEVSRERYPVDIIMRMTSYFERLGVTAQERETYKNLVEGGVDIAPTNEYQKAIYDAAKAAKKIR